MAQQKARIRRPPTVLGAAALIVLVATLGTISAAEAASEAEVSLVRSGVSGKPGKVTPYRTYAWAGAGSAGVMELGINGPDVYRTRGTRRTRKLARTTQLICVTVALWKFIPTVPGHGPNPWVLWGQRRQCVRIAPGRYWQSLKHPNIGGWHFYPAQTFVSWGTTVRVSWWSGSGRTRLGKVFYKYEPADYQCIDYDPGDINRCNVGPGPGGLGAVMFTY